MSTFRLFRVSRAFTAIALASALSSHGAAAQTTPTPSIESPVGVGLARASELSGTSESKAAPVSGSEAPLAWAGASLFALTYLASALVATTGYASASDTDTPRAALWVPAAGPFIMMGRVKAAGQDALLVLDGLSQVAGLTLFVYGLESKPLAVSVAPSTAYGAPGAMLFARF